MNKILFVVACEGNYRGLRGINDYTFIELDPDDKFEELSNEVSDVGSDLIWNLIYSYDTCEGQDEDEESAYENGQCWGYYFETDYTADQLEEIYENEYGFDDFNEFVEKYGGEEVE